jgi:hypothetical protein
VWQRQFYVAPDIDLFRINSAPVLNSSFYLLKFAKTPLPAIEFNGKGKVKFKPIKF